MIYFVRVNQLFYWLSFPKCEVVIQKDGINNRDNEEDMPKWQKVGMEMNDR